MPPALALLLLQLGCAAWPIETPSGDRLVLWVCPASPQTEASPAPPEERES